MVTVFQDTSGLAEGISQAGSALGQALGKRAEKQKELEKKQQTSSILGKTMENLNENSTWVDITKAFNEAVKKGVPVEDAKNAFSIYSDVVKSKVKEDEYSNILKMISRGEQTDQVEEQEIEDQASIKPKDLAQDPSLWGKLTADQKKAISLRNPQIANTLLKEEENQIKRKKIENEREEKRFDRSWELQDDFINKLTDQYTAWEMDTKPKLQQLVNLSDQELISPTAAKFMELMGIPLGALENPGSELFEKTSLDLLKGLPETFGNRILKVEVDNFLKTIPRLSNSAEGRKLIAANNLKLGEMKEAYYKAMRDVQLEYLDKEKPAPKDFKQKVVEKALPELQKLSQEYRLISNMANNMPRKDQVPFINPQGSISYLPKNDPEALRKAKELGGKQIW